MKLKAFAKVNLILNVVGKFENGYHDLQMLNAQIDIYDKIDISKNELNEDKLCFNNSSLDAKKDNLVLKCLDLLKKEFNINDTFTITITKNIPIGAGLGGGSSDAGSIIKYITKEYGLILDEKIIEKISILGADIPYFLQNGTCIVEGIGEKITKCDVKLPDEFVLINPNIYISTKDVFKNNHKISTKYEHEKLINLVNEKKYYCFKNDLEESCFELDENMKTFKNELSKIAYTVMSGSGSTMLLFGEDIDYIYDECKRKYPSHLIKKVKTI